MHGGDFLQKEFTASTHFKWNKYIYIYIYIYTHALVRFVLVLLKSSKAIFSKK